MALNLAVLDAGNPNRTILIENMSLIADKNTMAYGFCNQTAVLWRGKNRSWENKVIYHFGAKSIETIADLLKLACFFVFLIDIWEAAILLLLPKKN